MAGIDALYGALGLTPGASQDEVKRAFRRIARECHPDVAGGDKDKERRFAEARDAWETLSDPDKRAAAEAASRPPPPPRAKQGRPVDQQGAFFHAFYRRAAGKAGEAAPKEASRSHGATFRARSAAATGEGVDTMDDLFADFGFGGAPRSGASGGPTRGAGGAARRGDDVILDLEVPAAVARDGGRVTARYARLGRSPTWTPSQPGPGLEPRHEITELEVPAGTRHASVRRYSGLGDAGPFGGACGDLVVRMRVLDGEADTGRRREAEGREEPAARGPDGAARDGLTRLTVEVSVWEALLGGRVEVETPSGKVKMAFPPCSQPGRTFRLRGRGASGPDGPSDVLVELRVVLPERLDDAERSLVEQLAARDAEAPGRRGG